MISEEQRAKQTEKDILMQLTFQVPMSEKNFEAFRTSLFKNI
jgi:hypothetical protein